MSGLGDKLTKLAEAVLDELMTPDSGSTPPLDQRIEAIKVIGTLHLGLIKFSDKVDGEDNSAGSLPAMRAKIAAAANGEGK